MRPTTTLWALFVLLILGEAVTIYANVPPFGLQTSYLVDPIGIDKPSPRLSWSLDHPLPAQKQTAFRVQVYLSGTNSLVWDSMQVKSSLHHTRYGAVGSAKPLVSDTSYTWMVQWWDSQGQPSNWSMPARFDTGHLSQSDWSARWIGGGSGNLLRKQFSLSSAPSRARAFISGIGYYEFFLNNVRVGDAQLDVGWTDYGKRVLYNVYDITANLTAGVNVIGVMQGHGWYSSTEDREPNGPRSVLFQLSVDGKVVVVSDQSWSSAQGPVTYDGVYNGETYDTRLEQSGWAGPNFRPTGPWVGAQEVAAPGGVLTYQAFPPIREKVLVYPQKITSPRRGVYVIDFGQNFSGYTRISVTGPAGSNVSLHHAEVLQADGSGMIYIANLRGARATDTYIFNGGPARSLQPHFTYHGFRYVQWIASDASIVPTLSNIVGVHIHSDVPTTGSINLLTPNGLLNTIQHNILWGQASNLMSVPTDCDQRDERKGWMGDAQLSAEEAIHNFYMPAFYVNFLQNIRDEQDAAGTLTDTVPWTFGSRPADPAWGSAYPSLLYWMWKYYDDVDVLVDHFAGLKLYIDWLISQHAKTGLSNFFYNYGDWVPPPPFPMINSHMTSSFAFLSNLQMFVEIASVVQGDSFAQNYTAVLEKLEQEFNTAFYDAGADLYTSGLQSAQAYGLALGIVPGDRRNFTINLLNDIVTKQRTHLTTGIIGTKYLILALHDLGLDDVALALAEQIDYPSWGYMALHPVEPATTVWELWDSPNGDPGMDSRNHIMFGSVGDWFYKALAGIEYTAYGASGAPQLSIAPSVVGDLMGVYSEFVTGHGGVSSSWQKKGGMYVCSTAAEGHSAELSCDSIGSSGVIEEIVFASYGLPHGTCGSFGEIPECASLKAKRIVEATCIGKKLCSIRAHEDFLGKAACAEGTFKRLHVQAKCSEAAPTTLSLQADVPVGLVATVTLPLLDLASVVVSANMNTIWQNRQFMPTAGISAGALVRNTLAFTVGSGSYSFELKGTPGTVACGSTTEGSNTTLACPAGTVISQVTFASFGSPTGTCGNYFLGTCHAGSSKWAVESQCLLKQSCEIYPNVHEFGDPCFATPKTFAAQVVCARF